MVNAGVTTIVMQVTGRLKQKAAPHCRGEKCPCIAVDLRGIALMWVVHTVVLLSKELHE